jgi:hypothetical protein
MNPASTYIINNELAECMQQLAIARKQLTIVQTECTKLLNENRELRWGLLDDDMYIRWDDDKMTYYCAVCNGENANLKDLDDNHKESCIIKKIKKDIYEKEQLERLKLNN